MKNLLLAFSLVVLFNSCNTDDKRPASIGYEGKWKLTRMSRSSFSSDIKTGDAMDWQEFYILKNNGTFTKSRQQDGELTSIEGTYIVSYAADYNVITLTYTSENAIIGSCIPLSEQLLVLSNNLVKSAWQACDGPILEYEKVN